MTERSGVPRSGEPSLSLAEVCIERGGAIHGGRVLAFILTWGNAEHQLGHELGAEDTGSLSAAVREYAAFWKRSERTAWREITRFRKLFPEYESPADIVALTRTAAPRDQRDERDDRPALSELRLAG